MMLSLSKDFEVNDTNTETKESKVESKNETKEVVTETIEETIKEKSELVIIHFYEMDRVCRLYVLHTPRRGYAKKRESSTLERKL